jgi:hypothetical protein
MGVRRYSDAQLSDAVRTSRTFREVLIALGLAPYGGNYETVRAQIERLGLDQSHLQRRRWYREIDAVTDVRFAEVVSSSRSVAEALRKLGTDGGARRRFERRLRESGLDAKHFMGQAWRRGVTTPVVQPTPLVELLVDGRLVSPTNRLKQRLIAEGLKEPRCERCFRDRWNGRPIPLELDHANGRRDDNRLENLRILCPNCHAQTDTYRGRNIGARSSNARGV